MPDVLTPQQRHRCMSHIRSKATKPEILVRKWLWAHGYRYRLNVKSVPGKPDIVMRKYRTAIFWQNKIESNRQRDKRNYYILLQNGWQVIVLWQCELYHERIEKTMQAVALSLNVNFLTIAK